MKTKTTKLFFSICAMCLVFFPAKAGRSAELQVHFSSQVQPLNTLGKNSVISMATAVPGCESTGDAQYGSSLCKTIRSDGTSISAENHHETAWNDSKEQTVITEFDAESRISHQRVVRHKIAFSAADPTKKLKEFFDIVRYPPGQKITRELLTIEYFKNGYDIARISYAEYVQIADSAFAALIRNTVLAYDENGRPLRGHAELWKDGQQTKQLFRWDRRTQGKQAFDPELWSRWEEIINKVSPQQIAF